MGTGIEDLRLRAVLRTLVGHRVDPGELGLRPGRPPVTYTSSSSSLAMCT
jgi:hypothetical protein